MDFNLDHVLALAFGRLDATDSEAVRAAVRRSPELMAALERFELVAATAQADRLDPVPVSALSAATALGQRLESLRAPSFLDRATDAVRAVVAKLVFDSRLEGGLVGLRGGSGGSSGFVVNYELQPTAAGSTAVMDIELECAPLSDDRFRIVGQVTASRGGIAPSRITAYSDGNSADGIESPIDEHGMFHMTLGVGSFRMRIHTTATDIEAIELPMLDLP
jgi:hypothetical protein